MKLSNGFPTKRPDRDRDDLSLPKVEKRLPSKDIVA